MATDYTPNYNLDKYVATDKPNLRDQYNAAMDKIDLALLSANTNATEAKAATQSFQTSIIELQNTVSPYSSTNTIQNAISSKASQTDLNKLKKSSRYMVAIGDSFGDPNSGGIAPLPVKWPELVSQGLSINLINACKSGCGFTYSEGTVWPGQTDNKFIHQIDYASSVVDSSLVDYVFIYGGVNDYTRRSDLGETTAAQISALATAIIECARNAHNKFPYANIYIAYSNVGYARQARFNSFMNFWHQVSCIIAGLSVNNRSTTIVGDCLTWLVPWGTNAFQSDQLHPNTDGQHLIANKIISCITGGYSNNTVLHANKPFTVTGDNSTSMVLNISQVFSDFTTTLALKSTSGNLTFNNSGQHDIYSGLVPFKFGTDAGPYIIIDQGENYKIFYLCYSGILRVYTYANNITISDIIGNGTVMLT